MCYLTHFNLGLNEVEPLPSRSDAASDTMVQAAVLGGVQQCDS